MTSLPEALMARAKALKLHGLLAHWEEVAASDWIAPPIAWEADERTRRGLERRLGNAHLGRFKPLADFDWHWPTQCDRTAIEDLMGLRFLSEAANVVLVGPNGVGKTTIARNIAHRAVLAGHTVPFASAAHMLNELAGADGDNALRHRLSVYARPRLLVVDEVGYLSYSNRHADLLFEIVSRRYEAKSTLITTNRPQRLMGRGLPQRRLCRLPGRPPRPPRRDHRHPGRVLPPQGGQGTQRTAPQGPQPTPQGHRTRRHPALAIPPEHIHDEAADPRLLVP
jgi:DNA replication protein DnaC